MTVFGGASIVTPAGVVRPGWIRIDGDEITEVGGGSAPTGAADLDGNWVWPGFVDLHVHGGGGASMLSDEPDEIEAAAMFHRHHGTTTTLASLATAPVDVMQRGAAAAATVAEKGTSGVIGCHLEGPFLSHARCGAQDPRYLLDPDPATLRALLDAGRGRVRMITIAPERAGAIELVQLAVSAGVVAAIGHTDATYDEADAAVDAGATVATHLGNGMRPLHHREPGAVGAALRRGTVVCELINDGAHLHDAMVATFFAAAGPERVALITDAIPAAGAGDGRYQFGDRDVDVVSGVARLADGGALAGSTLTMDRAVQRAVRDVGLSVGRVAAAAATTPARVLGIGDRTGSITPRRSADLVVLDSDLEVVAVMARGRWVRGAEAVAG